MNRWMKKFMAGWPSLGAGKRLTDLADGDCDLDLWAEISQEADRIDRDLIETVPVVLRAALGARKLKAARAAVLGQGDWDEKTRFVCRRAALQACFYHDPRKTHTDRDIDARMKTMLLDAAELAEEAQQAKWLHLLKTAQPYNRLPC